MLKIGAILRTSSTDYRMDRGFSLNNRPKRAENTSGGHHAPTYHRFPDIQFQIT